jgi:hypothetical protein
LKPESSISTLDLMLLDALDYRDGDYSSKSRRISRDTSIGSVLLPLIAVALSQPLTVMHLGDCDSRGFGLGIDSLALMRCDLANRRNASR